jgi:hypothetical protein
LEAPDYINRDQLSIAMRVVKGDCDFTNQDLPENLALFLGGMAVSADPKSACLTEILKAYKSDRIGTINLAKKIGLDLRDYGMRKNMVFSKKR